MPLSIFADALPYDAAALQALLPKEMQRAPLVPNVGYSACLHRQLYDDCYPDDTGVLVDWVHQREECRAVRLACALLRPLDLVPPLGTAVRKVLDRLLGRGVFANVPFRYRARLCMRGRYVFRERRLYGALPLLRGYRVISQDDGARSFSDALHELTCAVEAGERDLFFVTGVFDVIGHGCARGEEYERRITPPLQALCSVIARYRQLHPDEEVLLLSDHGMSTVRHKVKLSLRGVLTRKQRRACMVYTDSCMALVFCRDEAILSRVRDYLDTLPEGHRLDETERAHYRVSDRALGDEIFILRQGYVFADSWFGCSWRRHPNGQGVHGFYPEKDSRDALACVLLLSERHRLRECYDYKEAHALLQMIMQGER